MNMRCRIVICLLITALAVAVYRTRLVAARAAVRIGAEWMPSLTKAALSNAFAGRDVKRVHDLLGGPPCKLTHGDFQVEELYFDIGVGFSTNCKGTVDSVDVYDPGESTL